VLFQAPRASLNFAADLAAWRPLQGALRPSPEQREAEASSLVAAYTHERKLSAWGSVGGESVWDTFSWQQKLAVVRSQVGFTQSPGDLVVISPF
jgi:hypothetical protein